MFIDSSFHITTHFCLEHIVFFPYRLSFSSLFIAFLFPAACLSFLGLLFPGGDISSVFLSLFFFFFCNLPFEDICYLFPANIAECLYLFPFPVLSFLFWLYSFFLLTLCLSLSFLYVEVVEAVVRYFLFYSHLPLISSL